MSDTKSLDEITKHISESFIHCEKQVQAFYFCYMQQEHGILYGPPGHGKSDIIKAFLNFVYPDDTFFMNVSRGIEKAEMLGGMDMKSLLTEGRMNYLTEFSFLNKRGVFMDELMDAPPARLAVLKNIFTEKGLWSEGKLTPMLSEVIFAATNHRPKEWAGAEDTNQAILDRFAVQIEVTWPKYEQSDFSAMFTKQLQAPYDTVAEGCELCHQRNNGKRMTPRTAIKVAKSFSRFGVLGFRLLGEIDETVIEEIERSQRTSVMRANSREVLRQIQANITKMDKRVKDVPTISKFLTFLSAYDKQLNILPMDNRLLHEQSKIKDSIDSAMSYFSNRMIEKMELTKADIDAWQIK